MQIHFSKEIRPRIPSNFVVKIWEGFNSNPYLREVEGALEGILPYMVSCPDWNANPNNWVPKIHTIRENKSNRWKPGMSIHFVQWTGIPYKSKTYQFAPVIPCVSVQQIKIINRGMYKKVTIDGKLFYHQNSKTCFGLLAMGQLIKNDGLNSFLDFWEWFSDEEFEGSIIHWTDLKY